jgi:hypothetical protein
LLAGPKLRANDTPIPGLHPATVRKKGHTGSVLELVDDRADRKAISHTIPVRIMQRNRRLTLRLIALLSFIVHISGLTVRLQMVQIRRAR